MNGYIHGDDGTTNGINHFIKLLHVLWKLGMTADADTRLKHPQQGHTVHQTFRKVIKRK